MLLVFLETSSTYLYYNNLIGKFELISSFIIDKFSLAKMHSFQNILHYVLILESIMKDCEV